jgi:hypothetical protein
LHSICDDDNRVARAFVVGLLQAVQSGRPTAPAARLLAKLPAEVTASQQSHLFAPVGRSALRRRIERVGAVDLDFKGPGGWRLLVELKIDAVFGPEQRPRYLSTRIPLVAVIRDRSAYDRARDTDLPGNWLGVVSWEELIPVLRALPISGNRARAEWRELVALAIEDGDLIGGRRRRSQGQCKQAAAILHAAWPEVCAALISAVELKYGKRAARRLEAEVERKDSGSLDGAGIGIGLRSEPVVWIALREPASSSPVVSVSWRPPSGRGAAHRLRDAHVRLQALGFERRRAGGEYIRERWLPSSDVRDLGLPDTLVRRVTDDLLALVKTGVVADDVARVRDLPPRRAG